MAHYLESLLFFGLFALVLNYVTYTKHFFHVGKERKATEGTSLAFLIGAFALFIAIVHAIPPLLSYIVAPFIRDRAELIAIAQGIQWLFVGGGFYLLHRSMPQVIQRRITGWNKQSAHLIYDILFASFVFLLSFPAIAFIDNLTQLLVQTFIEASPEEQIAVRYLRETKHHTVAYLTMIISACIYAPIIEEYLFRGHIQSFLRGYLGPRASILLSSFIFAAFHFSTVQSYSNIAILSSLFVLALYLGFCYEKQRSLICPIALHMLFNGVSVFRIHFFTLS